MGIDSEEILCQELRQCMPVPAALCSRESILHFLQFSVHDAVGKEVRDDLQTPMPLVARPNAQAKRADRVLLNSI